MRNRFFYLFGLFLMSFAFIPVSASSAGADRTATGIPLDSAWKKQVYEFARKNVAHPAWGLAHSERDYQVARVLAQREGFELDEEVLFVAAFLHDLGGIGSFAKPDVDHALRSTQIIEPLLATWGFPMSKWPQVKEMILGHVYYGPAPESRAALAFRDADILDFLGTIGVARILAITQDPERPSLQLKPMVDLLKDFAATLPAKCSLATCSKMAEPRRLEMRRFLNELDGESFGGAAL